MTDSQRLQVRASEIRTRLNDIAGLPDDGLNDEIRAETDRLTAEYRDVETRIRAALVAEDDERKSADARMGDAPDGEERELRALQGRVSLGRFLSAFAAGSQVIGAEREICEHRGLTTAGNVIPYDALVPPTTTSAEMRADTATVPPAAANPINQAAILPRVFARSGAARLQIAMPQVPVGQAAYPVLTAAEDGAFVAAGAVRESPGSTITSRTLTPQRLTGRFTFRVEDAATTAGLETSLRSDLSMALSQTLDQQILGEGDAQVRGMLATSGNGGLATYADPGAVVTYTTAAAEAARGVDGRYASMLSECTWLVHPLAWAKLEGLIQTTGDVSAAERMDRRLGAFAACANLPAVASNVSSGILAKLGQGAGLNAVAPVWDGIIFLRDTATTAGAGTIHVTAHMLANFAVVRADGFVRTKLKLA